MWNEPDTGQVSLIPIIGSTWNSQIHRDRNQNSNYQGLGKRGNGELFSEYRVLIWEKDKVSEMDSGDSCTIISINFMLLNCKFKIG